MTARQLPFAPTLRVLVAATALAATAASGNVPRSSLGVAPMAAADASLLPGHVMAANAVTSSASEVKHRVAIGDFAFQPAMLTVTVGSKVMWTNRDEEPHSVVSTGALFPSSPALDTDDSYATVFAKPGTYNYFCSIHPHMVGTIIVK